MAVQLLGSKMTTQEEVTLKVYQATSGEWAGILHDPLEGEVGRIAGCKSSQEVIEEARAQGYTKLVILVDFS